MLKKKESTKKFQIFFFFIVSEQNLATSVPEWKAKLETSGPQQFRAVLSFLRAAEKPEIPTLFCLTSSLNCPFVL